MDHGHHNVSNEEDYLRDGTLWADSVIEAAKRLDPPDEVQFLSEVIGLLTERRNEVSTFLHAEDATKK